jgi:hypothetical protein
MAQEPQLDRHAMSGKPVTREELLALLRRYRDSEPRRSTGGVSALAGFEFQIRVFLADYVEVLVRSEGLAAGVAAFRHSMEGLSDYTRGHVVVQVKRTLTSSKLAVAGRELARLDRFLETEGHGSSFLYEVVAQRVEGEPDWQTARGLAAVEATQVALRDRFERLLAEGRLLKPRIDPDPWWRLIDAVYGVLDAPFTFAREAVELALRRGAHPEGGIQAAETIAERFADHRRRFAELRSLPGRLLTAAEVTLAAETTREVVVGRIPTLAHLRDGRFASRSARLGDVLKQLDSLEENRARRIDEFLDVFWIDGRSGSGKSVLLLQLVQALILEREERVVWLGDRSGDLESLLERWPRLSDVASLPSFVAIDDLYDPQGREDLDLPNISHLVRERSGIHWPIVLTCGPPEFRERFVQDSRGEGIAVRSWTLPPLSTNETHWVESWFENRTGRHARPAAAARQKQGLMVSLLFELAAAEDLGSFGNRFVSRLEASRLGQALLHPLVLNRLYIWAPFSWLSTEERNRLDRLNEDEDFTFLAAETIRERYLKLSHPHLSDSIYKALRPGPGAASIHARDLAAAYGRCLDGSPTVAQRVLSSVAAGHERIDHLDQEVLAEEMTAAWNARVDVVSEATNPGQLAWTWVSWARWAAREPSVEPGLETSPLRKALDLLLADGSHPQWGILWGLLAEAYPLDRELVEVGRSWVTSSVARRRDRTDWPYVWERTADLAEEGEGRNNLFLEGWAWLFGREDHLNWHHVWRALVHHRGSLPAPLSATAVLSKGWRWLQRSGRLDRPDWSYAWQALADVWADLPAQQVPLDEVQRLAWEWLGGEEQRGRPEWVFVWQKLVDLRRQSPCGRVPLGRLLALGWDWVLEGGRQDQAEWRFMWQKLVDVREDLPRAGISVNRLLVLGWRWIEEKWYEELPEWVYMWQKLVDARRDLPREEIPLDQVFELGWAWLEEPGNEERPEWSFMWQKLVDVRDALPRQEVRVPLLLGRGWSWIRQEGREDVPEWNYVWQRLVDASGELAAPEVSIDQVLMLGWSWLGGDRHRGQPEWNFVWQKLVDAWIELPRERGSLDRLLVLGWDWLREDGRASQPGWSYVWRKLVEVHPRLAEASIPFDPLLRLGWDWLRTPGRGNQLGWTHVWRKLVDFRSKLPEEEDLAEVLGLGWAWLHEEGGRSHPEWNFVLQELIDRASKLPAGLTLDMLLQMSMSWVREEGRQRFPAWTFVWRKLVDARSNLSEAEVADLVGLGWGWLMEDQHRDGAAWTHVWEKLVEARADLADESARERLLAVGWQWLREAGRRNQPDWTFVWQRLVELRADLPEDQIPLADLLEAGSEWLGEARQPRRNRWTVVWQTLVDTYPELPGENERGQLLEMGWDWLQEKKDASHAKWSSIWLKSMAERKTLSEVRAPFDQLEPLGWYWLTKEGAAEQPGWVEVWKTLVDGALGLPDDRSISQLLELGWSWLEVDEHRVRRDWTSAWQKLLDVEPSLPAAVPVHRLLDLGEAWVREEGHWKHPSWPYVWCKLAAARSELGQESALRELVEVGWVRGAAINDGPEITLIDGGPASEAPAPVGRAC